MNPWPDYGGALCVRRDADESEFPVIALFKKMLPPGQLVPAASPRRPNEQERWLPKITTHKLNTPARQVAQPNIGKQVASTDQPRSHLRSSPTYLLPNVHINTSSSPKLNLAT